MQVNSDYVCISTYTLHSGFTIQVSGRVEGNDQVDVATTVNGDVAVVMLEGVNPAPALESELGKSLKQRLAQVQGQRVYQQYIDALRANAEVTISEAL